jgi:solute carrier family 25 carnitine/acylcarnitine transporter 20/29
MMGWFTSFPLDSIKSSIQGTFSVDTSPVATFDKSKSIGTLSASASHSNPSTLSVARTMLRQRGLAGLYSGVGPSLMRAFLVSSSRFAVYEWVLRELS